MHRSLLDWESRGMATDEKSRDLKQMSRLTRSETDKKSSQVVAQLKLASHQSNVGLSCRIQDVEKVKAALEQSLGALREEKVALLKLVDSTEYAQDDVRPLMDVVFECQGLRQERNLPEMVDDDAHKQFLQTEQMLEETVAQLQHFCADAQKHLRRTLTVENKLEAHVDTQEATLQVDRLQLALTEQSPDISCKLNPLRQTRGTISEQSWEENVVAILVAAEEAMADSRSFRERIKIELIHVKRKLQAKKDAVQYALRKCVHRQNQAIDKLQWQHETLSKESGALETNTSKAERRLEALDFPMKLAETRLENRNKRPELCYDVAQRTLASHVTCVANSKEDLNRRIYHLRKTRKLLSEHLDNIERDLNGKRRALDIDKLCLQIFDRFNETLPDNPPSKADSPRATNFPVPILE